MTVEPSVLAVAALGLSLLVGSLGVVLFYRPHAPQRRLGCRLILLAAGLQIGVYSVVRSEQKAAFVCLPLPAVAGYEVLLDDDALRTRTGATLLRGKLLTVRGRDGSTVRAGGSVQVRVESGSLRWGDRLLVAGRLSQSNSGSTDWTGTADSASIVDLGPRSRLFELRRRAHLWVVGRLRRVQSADAALFMALFLGVRDDLSGAETYFFRRAGAIHLLALSGFHLGILSFILAGALTPLLGKSRATAVTAVLLFVYLFVAGPKISLLRAVLMFLLLGLCRLASIRVRGIDLLGAVFLVSVLVWPASLTTLSFQLSYSALCGILIVSPPVERALAAWVPRFIRAPIAAALAAMCATGPILAGRFGMIYPVGLLSSLVLTPLVTGFLWIGLFSVFIPAPDCVVVVPAAAMHLGHQLLLGCAELFARANPVRVAGPGVVAFPIAAVLLSVALVSVLRRAALRAAAIRHRRDSQKGRPETSGERHRSMTSQDS